VAAEGQVKVTVLVPLEVLELSSFDTLVKELHLFLPV
jgi:hypothetical protein